MRQIKTALTRYWPLILLGMIELVLFFTNYATNTYLMGWDNVMPEFNFKANLVRNIIGVWQEHRGLGLYDGMSHIALTLHTLFLWGLSIFLPNNILRYVFNILMHFMGGIGMYFLCSRIYNQKSLPRQQAGRIIPLISALFYLFNPATIQMFYTPLESFSVHFVALPWLALVLINYLKSNSKKSLFWFFLVTLLITPQYFITTLFLSTLGIILPILITHLIQKKNITVLKQCAVIIISFLLINSFWLIPYVFGIPQNAPIIQSAKINEMSSQEIFLRNQAFGNIKDVLLLRGFSLDYVDLNSKGISQLIMLPWRTFLYQPAVTGISLVLLTITAFGLTKIKKNRQLPAFLIIFILGFFMLGTDIPGIRELITFLRNHIPIFKEIFRFTFTKFSLLFAFAYTIFLANGLREIVKIIKLKAVVYISTLVIVLILAVPAFQGNFFYQQLKVKLPNDYLQLFNFMGKINPNSRVAIFPQPEFWSWKHYQYGYSGSGFMWYGLNQPLMDRAFDPWSNNNEAYYWEISQAIYQKNSQLFIQILNKYGINYVILDQYLISSGNQTALFDDEIKQMIDQTNDFEQISTFNKLSVYQIKNTKSDNFISLAPNLPKVAPNAKWLEKDQAYVDLQNYISTDQNSDIFYPFRSLFSKRSSSDLNSQISITDNQIMITSETVPHQFINLLPNEIATDGATLSKNQNNLVFKLDKNAPIYNGNTDLTLNSYFVNNDCNPFKDGIAGNQNIKDTSGTYLNLTASDQRNCLSFDIPDLMLRNAYLIAITSRNITGLPLRLSLINSSAKHIELETFLHQGNTWQTDYFVAPPLASDGLGYMFYVINDGIGDKKAENDIRSIQIYQIPYEFLKEIKLVDTNSSKLEVQSNNSLFVNPDSLIYINHSNPAEYILNVKFKDQNEKLNNESISLSQAFNEGWQAYILPECQSASRRTNFKCQIMQLFPFIFGKRLTNHILVNNWENGWLLDNKTGRPASPAGGQEDNKTTNLTVYIMFWPQLLEFAGFILLPIPFLWLLRKK